VPPIALGAVLRGSCPACGNASVFRGFIALKPACPACGHNLVTTDAGDGPAFFAIMLVGFLVTCAAAITELQLSPPYWLHAALWLPLTLVLSLFTIRFMKSYLIALEHHLRH
jgi:uncharacterized protein (DUF983 family)